MYKTDFDKLRKKFPEDVPESFLKGGNRNEISIRKNMSLESLVQKGYLKLMDTDCCEY